MAMTKSDDRELEFACELAYAEQDYIKLPKTALGMIDDDMPKQKKFDFLNSHKDQLSECFIGAKINVKDIVKSELAKAQSETYVKILPLRFIVEFGEQSALIYYLRKKE